MQIAHLIARLYKQLTSCFNCYSSLAAWQQIFP